VPNRVCGQSTLLETLSWKLWKGSFLCISLISNVQHVILGIDIQISTNLGQNLPFNPLKIGLVTSLMSQTLISLIEDFIIISLKRLKMLHVSEPNLPEVHEWLNINWRPHLEGKFYWPDSFRKMLFHSSKASYLKTSLGIERSTLDLNSQLDAYDHTAPATPGESN